MQHISPNTPSTNTPPSGIIITDKAIEETFQTEEEKEIEKKPLTEAEVEEAVGGDMPVEGFTTMNIEDEEVEKEADII
jgi:hypothetical protein